MLYKKLNHNFSFIIALANPELFYDNLAHTMLPLKPSSHILLRINVLVIAYVTVFSAV